MHIIHFDTDDTDSPLSGGQPVRTYNINKYLVKSGHDVEVVTASFKGSSKKIQKSGIQYRRLGITIPFWGLSSHFSYLFLLGFLIKCRNVDLIVEEFSPPLGFYMTPVWGRKPVVLIVQWFFFEFWEKRYHLPFKRWMMKLPGKNRYKYVIVQTGAMKETFQKILPNAVIKKIPCGIDSSSFLTNSNPTGNYVLFLGRLDDYQKGITLLLDSWKDHGLSIPLCIAGDGKDRTVLENTAKNYALQKVVSFTGRVSGEKKNDLLRNCRFVVVPSREETFGIVALEAMAAGKPVVCFNIDNLNELVTSQCGILVKPFETSLYSQAVEMLWNDIDRCVVLGGQGQKNAKDYLWDEIARQQEHFYQEIVSKEREK